MKTLLLPTMLVLLAGGCQQLSAQSEGATASSNTADSSEQAKPPVFEIRDFSLNKVENEYKSTVYTGRGTLVTRDPRLAQGDYFVFVTAKQTHEDDEEGFYQVLLKDGLGTISTSAYQLESEKDETVKYHDWQIVGYVPLQKAVIKSPSDNSPAAQG